MGRSLDEILGDHAAPKDAMGMDDLRRLAQLSQQETNRLEAEGYLDPVYVSSKGFMASGEQARRVITLAREARKAGGRFPPALPALAEHERAGFTASGGAAAIAAQLLEPFRYTALQRIWSRVVELATPAARLRRSPTGASTRSRLGGVPDLPAGVAWPRHRESPLSFIAQVDLAEVARLWPASPLPASGLLSLFYDAVGQPWGFDPAHRGGWAVYHFDQPSLAAAEPPDDLPEDARFRALPVLPVGEIKLPAGESKVVEDLELRLKERDAYWALLGDLEQAQQDGDPAVHRLLGHPDPIQGDMEAQCQLVSTGIDTGDPDGYRSDAARRLLADRGAWRLLLQVDSDERTAMLWGDDGRLYVWMREPSIAARRWDEAWLCLQCF